MMPLSVGIDIGTSGARAVAVTAELSIVAQASARMASFGDNHRDPHVWWAAVCTAFEALLRQVDPAAIRALAVDGTSGTVLPVDTAGQPLADGLMYNDPVADDAILDGIAAHAPAISAAHGPTSGLAKAIRFQALPGVAQVLHQADWIAGQFSGRFDVTDENNALKTGYDPVARCWPDWIAKTGLRDGLLPRVVAPGLSVGLVSTKAAARFGLSAETLVVAGTTDGCASFLATGASESGDGVSALGTSLTLKVLSDTPIFAPEYGIYSHRLGDVWLAGGASNTGGKVLLHFFPAERIAALSEGIDPGKPSGLDFYPLVGEGERFPIADKALAPRLSPRPADDALFLAGLFEGIAAIEALGYRRLAELGAPALTSLRSVGGGAANPVWSAIRQRHLGVPFKPAASDEAAAGTARLALAGAHAAGVA